LVIGNTNDKIILLTFLHSYCEYCAKTASELNYFWKKYGIDRSSKKNHSHSYLIDKEGYIHYIYKGEKYHIRGGPKHKQCNNVLNIIENKIK